MFVQVRLLKGFPQELLYAVPAHLEADNLVGQLVRVPIQTHVRSALVIQQLAHKPKNVSFIIKEIQAIEPFPHDPFYSRFIDQLSTYQQVNKLHLIKRIQQFLVEKESATDYIPEEAEQV